MVNSDPRFSSLHHTCLSQVYSNNEGRRSQITAIYSKQIQQKFLKLEKVLEADAQSAC